MSLSSIFPLSVTSAPQLQASSLLPCSGETLKYAWESGHLPFYYFFFPFVLFSVIQA